MRLPSKIFSVEESIISKFPIVLTALEKNSQSASELYTAVKNKTENLGEFLEILDCLYALGKIQYEQESRALKYVDRNKM